MTFFTVTKFWLNCFLADWLTHAFPLLTCPFVLAHTSWDLIFFSGTPTMEYGHILGLFFPTCSEVMIQIRNSICTDIHMHILYMMYTSTCSQFCNGKICIRKSTLFHFYALHHLNHSYISVDFAAITYIGKYVFLFYYNILKYNLKTEMFASF